MLAHPANAGLDFRLCPEPPCKGLGLYGDNPLLVLKLCSLVTREEIGSGK